MKARIILITLLCTSMAGVPGTHAATIVVTNTNDSGPGSLRYAIAVANDGDTIDATGVSGTILLTTDELRITHSVTIKGPGAVNLAVNGNGSFRVFENFASTVISGFTITNGFPTDQNGGGGILNHGALTVSGSSVVSNGHSGIGSAVTVGCDSCVATLTITNSTVSGNSGGGLFSTCGFGGTATLTVSNCTISGNSGTGIYNAAFGENGASSTVTVSNSTLSSNSVVGDGGAIYNVGGAFHASAGVSITNSTITGNSATGNGGGIYNSHESNGYAEVDLGSTILNAGSSGQNIFNSGGTVTSLGYNVSSDDGGGFLTGPGDQINTDPMLGPLQDNGGTTFTYALLPGSPAIDHGDPNFTPPPFYDQRGPGFDRIVNGRIDIGSFEVQVAPTSAFSRKVHGGAGTFDIPLLLSGGVGIECRTGPTFQMIINFATNVTVESASMTSGTGMVSSFSGNGTPVIAVNLSGVTDAQRITVTLHGVNDGMHTGDVPVSMGVLAGDVNGNAAVNASDVSLTNAEVGQSVSSSNFREDVNYNGTITATDAAIVKSDVGHALLPNGSADAERCPARKH